MGKIQAAGSNPGTFGTRGRAGGIFKNLSAATQTFVFGCVHPAGSDGKICLIQFFIKTCI